VPDRGRDQRPPATRPRGHGRPRGTGAARGSDPVRRAALDVLRAVDASDAYANLVLPRLLTERGIGGRDAAFATELTYGTLRLRGRYDAILGRTSSRPLAEVDPPVLDVLRLGAHQLLGMRVPAHAAVSETVALAREVAGTGRAQFVNAVLRAVATRSLEDWLTDLRAGPEPLAAEHSHPPWVVRALRESLVANGRPASELPELLAADNAAPEVTLVARPGVTTPDDLRREAASAGLTVAGPGRFTPTALRLDGGDPRSLPSVRSGRAGVQDEGSQLVALAAAGAAPTGATPRWLDLCAGPGGKAALLGAVLARRTGGLGLLVANEVAPHRAALVRDAVRALPPVVEVRVGDGRDLGAEEPGAYDLVLLDAPCTGLGALRRRPEARWRRDPEDVPQLAALQRDLLRSAIAATAVGGMVAYVTCSPHLAETHAVVADATRRAGVEVVDASAAIRAAASGPVPDLGPGPFVQLWPHVHGVDAMFLALLRRAA
jgi:16S rRNA (cytosine967-C5)-methyltransferase